MYKAQQEALVGTQSSAQGHCNQGGVIRETPFSSGPGFLKAEEERQQLLHRCWESLVGCTCENCKTSEHSRDQTCVCGHP